MRLRRRGMFFSQKNDGSLCSACQLEYLSLGSTRPLKKLTYLHISLPTRVALLFITLVSPLKYSLIGYFNWHPSHVPTNLTVKIRLQDHTEILLEHINGGNDVTRSLSFVLRDSWSVPKGSQQAKSEAMQEFEAYCLEISPYVRLNKEDKLPSSHSNSRDKCFLIFCDENTHQILFVRKSQKFSAQKFFIFSCHWGNPRV